MSRSLALALVCVFASASSSVALAQGAPFPVEAVDRHTFAVGFVDLSRVTRASLGESAKLLLGEDAEAMTAGALAMLDAALKPLTDAGAERVYLAIATQDARGEPPVQIFVRHKAGADREALTAALAAMTLADAAMEPIGDRWLKVEPPRPAPAQPGPDQATRAALDGELAAIDAAGGGYAFVMTQQVQQLLKDTQAEADKRPGDADPFEAAALEVLLAATEVKSARTALHLGAQPSYDMLASTQNPDAAASLVAALQKLRTQVDARAKQGGGRNADFMVLAPTLALLGPEVDGSDVVVHVDAAQLTTFGQTVLVPSIKSARAAAAAVVAANHIRQLHIAALTYAIDNNAKFPDTLDVLFENGYLNDRSILTHPATGESPGFEYVGKGMTANNAGPNTPIIYELRNGQRDPAGYVGYADGSVRKSEPPAEPQQ